MYPNAATIEEQSVSTMDLRATEWCDKKMRNDGNSECASVQQRCRNIEQVAAREKSSRKNIVVLRAFDVSSSHRGFDIVQELIPVFAHLQSSI